MGKIAERIVYLYDQDGTLTNEADRARRRRLDYRRHPDGTASGEFHFDPVTAEAFETVLDAKLSTMSAEERGTRTATQVRHDALCDLLFAWLRTGQLPATTGVTTTLVVHLDWQQWLVLLTLTGLHSRDARPADPPERDRPPGREPGPPGKRLAVTNHEAFLTLGEVAPLLGDAQILPVVLSGAGTLKRVQAYGAKHRIFTPNQRLALAARDHGCTFIGCTTTPAYCEAHHVIDHAAGGRTSIDNAALVCAYHHRHFAELGYTCTMINGVPHWTPPTWIDPTRTPQRNTAHEPARAWSGATMTEAIQPMNQPTDTS